MFSSWLFRSVFVLLALVPLSSADTLTVGPLGSGAQFTEIQAAIDAAQDDDVILVRAGTYRQIVVDKPLRILGEGSGMVGIRLSVIIRDIGAGQELVLSGVRVGVFELCPTVFLQNCPGTVLLQDVEVGLPIAFAGATPLRVENCARAVLLDSRVLGGGEEEFPGYTPAVRAQDSTLWIANAEITGIGLASSIHQSATPGVHLVNSALYAWRTSILGGDIRGSRCDECAESGGPGILAVGSTVNLFGGPSSSVVGGQGGYDAGFPGGAEDGGVGVRLTGNSHARIQADIPIRGGLDGDGRVQAPAVQTDGTSSFTLDPKVFPTLVSSARQTQLGSTFSLTLDGNPGSFQVLYLSLRTGPTRTYRGVDGFGLLDQTNLFHVVSEVMPASGSFTVATRVPNLSALLGATLFFQTAERFPVGLVLRQSGPANRFAIGNPVLVTVTR